MNTYVGNFTEDEKFFLDRRFRGYNFEYNGIIYMATKGTMEFWAYTIFGLAGKIEGELNTL